MSSPNPLSTVLGPGIVGLFIQGLITGLVIAQFSRWFSAPERNENAAFSALIIFLTAVGWCVFFRLNTHITLLTSSADKVCNLVYISHPPGQSTSSSLGRMCVLPLLLYFRDTPDATALPQICPDWMDFIQALPVRTVKSPASLNWRFLMPL
jgi:hypothetical protein